MATVTVSRTADRLIAVKQVPPGRAGDIEREAATLRRLDHPGVVRFVNVADTRDGGRALHTEFVSSDTWATRPLIDPADRAGGVAALAEVVADLHDLGIAHGRIDPSHVLHGEDDRPVLCGLRLAAEATPENRREDLVALADLCCDPALERGPLTGKLTALSDAARAGRLGARELARRLGLLIDKKPTAAQPVPVAGNRSGRGRSERSRRRPLIVVTAVLSASLALLAAGIWSRSGRTASTPATITDAAGSPGLSPLTAADAAGSTGASPATPADAAALADATGGASAEALQPLGSIPAMAPASGSATGAATETAAAADPAAITSAATETVAAADPAAVPGASGPGAAVAVVPRTGGTGSGYSPAPSGSLLPPIPVAADQDLVEGHSTGQSGTVVEHGGSLYSVGAPGDFVRTGDWDCDGQPTPAIVRPSSGHVVLFDVWPGPGQSISMPVRWEVDAPTGAEVVESNGCDLLRVYTPAGSRLFDPMEHH